MRTRQQVWILIALATGVCVVPTCFAQRIPPTAVPYGNSWALLIGVNKYQNFPGNLQLRYAVNDVNAMRRVLVDRYGFPEANVTTLIDGEATKQGIEDAMAEFADPDRIKDNDRVLIFFSGHGGTVTLPSGGSKGYLMPHDAEIRGISSKRNSSGFRGNSSKRNPSDYYRTCVGMDRLRELSSFIPAKHTLFLVDACYSGAATRAIPDIPPFLPDYLRTVSSLQAAQVITAGLSGEQVVEVDGQGAFTRQLVKALELGLADRNPYDGVTTATELGTYLSGSVPAYVHEVSGRQQHPHFGRYRGEGEFLFIHPLPPEDVDVTAAASAQPRQDITPPVIEISGATILDQAGERVLRVVPTSEVTRFNGVVTDDTGVANVEVDGRYVPIRAVRDGSARTVEFTAKVDMARRVRREVVIRATDLAGNAASRTVSLDFQPEAPSAAGMTLISSGPFWMGASTRDGQDDEYPRREVHLDAFYIDMHEVTVGRYRKFVEDTGHRSPDWKKVARYSPTDQHPIVLVSWRDAAAFAEWAGKRLPTEAEWERAAGGSRGDRKYPWGNDADVGHANLKGTESQDVWRYCAPVGSFAANEHGVFDLGGNVWEWCSDGYKSDYYTRSPDRNPTGPEQARNHVARGGSWDHHMKDLRVGNRQALPPSSRYGDLGFRCAADALDKDGRPRDPLELNVLELYSSDRYR